VSLGLSVSGVYDPSTFLRASLWAKRGQVPPEVRFQGSIVRLLVSVQRCQQPVLEAIQHRPKCDVQHLAPVKEVQYT
jgi:hypothetical protein